LHLRDSGKGEYHRVEPEGGIENSGKNNLRFEEWPDSPGIWLDFAAGSLGRFSLQTAVWNLQTVQAQAERVRTRAFQLENLLRRLEDLSGPDSVRILENLDRLRRPGSLAVVTTIHASLVGGPAFHILKCLAAVKACRELAKYAIEAVPVCWISTAPPADFSRWTAGLLDHGGELHPLGLKPESADFPVGAPLPRQQMEDLLGKIQELGQGTFDEETIDSLRSACGQGATLSSAAARLFLDWMSDWGMIVLDSGAPELKTALEGASADLRRREDEIRSLLRKQSAILAQSGYVGQFPDDFLPDFPQQSCVLPVAAVVLDPYEIHSFVKSLPIFAELGLPCPLVCPQSRATLVDARSRRTLGKYRLDIHELFTDASSVTAKIRDTIPRSAEKRLEDLALEVDLGMTELGTLIPGGDENAETRGSCRERILYQIERMRQRCEAAAARREAAANRQIRRARNFLAPGGRSQERGLAGICFLLRYSRAVLQVVYEKLDIFRFEHQIISMD